MAQINLRKTNTPTTPSPNRAGIFINNSNELIVIDENGNQISVADSITGGTYSNNILNLNKSDGSTIQIAGFTDFYTTGVTLSNTTLEFDRTDQLNAYSVNLSNLVGVTGGTYDSNTNNIFFTGTHPNNFFSFSVSGLSQDIFVTGGTYNNSTGVVTFNNNNGDSFDVPGFVAGFADFYTTGVTLNGTVLEFDRTDSINAYNVDLNGLTSSNFSNSNLTLTGNRTHELNGNNLQIGEGASIFSFSGSNFSAITGGFLVINPQFSSLLHTDSRYIEINNASINFYNANNVTNITPSAVTFNQNGNDVDFVIEGATDLNLFFTDASTDRVGIGTNTPTEKLEVSGNTKINGTLNVSTMGTGATISNLGIDSNGFVVSGVSSGVSGEWTGGTNYILVKAEGTDTENADELLSAYQEAISLTSSSANTITIIASPGYYNFSSSTFNMNEEYINLVSLDGNRSVVFNTTLDDSTFSARTEGSINITANNVFVKGVDVQTKNFTIGDDLNQVIIENCKGGNFSFGGVPFTGATELIVSGTYINCEGGDLSFGGNGEAIGNFTNCVGGEESFGFISSSGNFINCQGGDFSFAFAGVLDGNFENCKGGDLSFGSVAFLVIGSNTKNCQSGDGSFGFSSFILNSTFENCVGGFGSFGGSYDTTNEGKFYNCRLTDGTFDTPTLNGFIILGIDGNNNVQNITGI